MSPHPTIIVYLLIAVSCDGMAQQIGEAAQLEQDGRIREALSAYLESGIVAGDKADAYAGVVRCARALLAYGAADDDLVRHLEDSVAWYNAHRDDPLRLAAVDSLVLAYMRQKKPDQAVSAYDASQIALADVSDDADYAFNYARAHELSGHRADAFSAYLRVMDLAPELERAAAGAIDTAETAKELAQVTASLDAKAPPQVAIPQFLRALDRAPEEKTVLYLARAYVRARFSREQFEATQASALRLVAEKDPSGSIPELVNGLIAAFNGTIPHDTPVRPFVAWMASEQSTNIMAALLTQVADQFRDDTSGVSDQSILRQAAAWALCPRDPTILLRYLGSRQGHPGLPIGNQAEIDLAALVPEASVANPELPSRDEREVKEEQMRLDLLAARSGPDPLLFRERAAVLDDELSAGGPSANPSSANPGVHEFLGIDYGKRAALPEAHLQFQKARGGYEAAGNNDGVTRMDEAMRRTAQSSLHFGITGLTDALAFYDGAAGTISAFLGLAPSTPYLRIGQPDGAGSLKWTDLHTNEKPVAMTTVLEDTADPRDDMLAIVASQAGQFAIVRASRNAAYVLASARIPDAPIAAPTALTAYRAKQGPVHVFASYTGDPSRCVAQYILYPQDATKRADYDRYGLSGWIASEDGECDVKDIAVDPETGTVYVLNAGTVFTAQAVSVTGATTLMKRASDLIVAKENRVRIYLDGHTPGLVIATAESMSAAPVSSGRPEGFWHAPSTIVNVRSCYGGRTCMVVLLDQEIDIISLAASQLAPPTGLTITAK